MLPPVGNVYDIPDKSTTIHGTTTSDYCSALTSGSEATNDVEDEIYSCLQDLSVARLSVEETSQLWVPFQRAAYPLCYIEKCLHVCIYSSAPFSACGYECVSNVATCTLVGQGLTIINNNERWVPGTTAVRSTFVAFRGFCTLVPFQKWSVYTQFTGWRCTCYWLFWSLQKGRKSQSPLEVGVIRFRS